MAVAVATCATFRPSDRLAIVSVAFVSQALAAAHTAALPHQVTQSAGHHLLRPVDTEGVFVLPTEAHFALPTCHHSRRRIRRIVDQLTINPIQFFRSSGRINTPQTRSTHYATTSFLFLFFFNFFSLSLKKMNNYD